MAQSTQEYLIEKAADIGQSTVEVGKDALQSTVEVAAEVGADALQSTVEVGKDALSNLTDMSRDFLAKKGYIAGEGCSQDSNRHKIAVVRSGNMSSVYGVDYFSIFLGVTGYYVAASMNIKSYTDITKDYQHLPTHLMWGAGFGLAACLVACIYPPYTKLLVGTVVGYKLWVDIVRPKLKGDDELTIS